jgi:primosomal protein N' (replication factor Y) (superfamily II helicase)
VSYAAVFPLVRTRAFAGAFDYGVPPALAGEVGPGALVAVPLGSRTVVGVVLEVRQDTERDRGVLPINDVLDLPRIPGDLLVLARRLEHYYLTSFSAALTLVCPPLGALRIVRRYELSDAGRAAIEAGEPALERLVGLKLPAGPMARLAERYRRKGWLRVSYGVHLVSTQPPSRLLRRGTDTPSRVGPRQAAALRLVEEAGSFDERALRGASGVSSPGLRRLVDSGALVEVFDGDQDRREGPRWLERQEPGGMPELLPEQQRAFDVIRNEAAPGDEVLVHGVTGSGKTEVYLRAAQATLEEGRSVLFLVPEIGLTGQTVTRVRERFGAARVAVVHSGLAAGERLLSYRAVATGEACIVVGARSAVFAPLVDLGLIVVDEEHDVSYKQEGEPAYDARTVARWRAEASGGIVVLGSATPSVESFARVALHADLRRRVDGSKPPSLEIVDMRGHHGVFSAPLAEALVATADAGEKAILFLNRRGFAAYLTCGRCGFTWACPQCDLTLTLFRGSGLRCRACGHAEPAPEGCPSCGGLDIVRRGMGTERVEREVHGLLPDVELLRLDSDVAASHGRLRAVLERFAQPGAKIIVGTQMIAKGHHYPDVTLVGVVDADLTLRFPDFRAEERTFSMLVQVGGRSGRGHRLGRVIVQTLSPEVRPIAYAAEGKERRFYEEEMERRRELGYPPATTLIALELSGSDERKVTAAGHFTAERLLARLHDGERVLGPGPLWRVRGRHACRVVIKTTGAGQTLDSVRDWLDSYRDAYARRGVRVVPDVDPQWL